MEGHSFHLQDSRWVYRASWGVGMGGLETEQMRQGNGYLLVQVQASEWGTLMRGPGCFWTGGWGGTNGGRRVWWPGLWETLGISTSASPVGRQVSHTHKVSPVL